MAKVGSWTYDLVNNKLIWSDEVHNIFELDKKTIEPSYEAFLDAIHPEDKKIVDESYQNSLKTKQSYSIKHRLLMKDGRVKWVKEECQTQFDENGKALVSAGTIQDITKDIDYQNKLNQHSKLASMGEMIGNIAHQWRQPLSVITTQASGLKIKMELDGTITSDDLNSVTDSILQQANYLSNTINNFTDFIKGDLTYTQISIKSTLIQSIELVQAALDMNYITLVKDIEDDLEITGNNHELEQAFINIFNNAKDALKEKIKNEDDRFIFVSTKKLEENSLEIIIKDSGGGVDESIIDKVFEPYFSTKHASVGTGLGLSLVDKILRERHKATIDFYNQEFEYNNKIYKGVCFTIKFTNNTKEEDQ